MVISSSSMERTAQVAAKLEAAKTLDRLVEEGAKTPDEAAAEKERLLKQPARKKWRVNMRVLLGALLLIALAMAALRAAAEPNGLAWLFAVVPAAGVAGDIAVVLGPLLAVSVAVERLLETAFDAFEQSARAVADVLAAPKEALDWIGREYQAAYEAAAAAASTVGQDASDEALAKLAAAEARLAQAEARVRAWTSAPEYVAWKRALCIWAGLVVGLGVAIFGDLGMLRIIGAPAPRLLDMVVTGLVIGAGPGPMHALIGIIQSGKDAANNLADLARSKAAELKAAADALKKA
ncbi:MAG: hypothetical protein QHH80_04675 [Anaerolineae bacterium]|nr:hypothetical protein [Anaerolineae bacterium]